MLRCRKVKDEIVSDSETDELKMHDSTAEQCLRHLLRLTEVITQVHTEKVLVTDSL